jgi:hypothetical protein
MKDDHADPRCESAAADSFAVAAHALLLFWSQSGCVRWAERQLVALESPPAARTKLFLRRWRLLSKASAASMISVP